MVFKNRSIRDPIAAFRGGSGPSVSPTIPTTTTSAIDHKVQKPITTLSTDTILHARSTSSLKRQGSIGVVGGGILKKESRHHPERSINNDDSSLYSIGTFDDGGFHANNIESRTDDNDTIVRGSVDTNNILLDNSERRVRWGKGVKAGSRHGCGVGIGVEHGCGGGGGGVTAFYNGLITNLNVINDKLDSGVLQLNTRMEGLGMRACSGAQCGTQHVNDDIISSEVVNEENDLIYSPKDEMLVTMLETRDAIRASSDAIVSSRDAINEEMRESRQCIEESRGIMSDCREAIIQSNNIANMAREEELMKLTSPKNYKHFTFDQLGGPSGRVAKYRHSIETGMGDVNVLSPTQEDPFSSSMHAHQRSPRGAMLRKYHPSHGAKGGTSPSNAADVPTSIHRKDRRSSSSSAALPTYVNTTSSRARQLLVSATGRRYKDKNQYRTTNVSVKNADKHSTSTSRYNNNNNTSTKPSTSSSSSKKKKKKKNMSSLVIGGLKKPLKFMSHGVKSNLKTRGPKLVLTWT